MKTLAVIGVGSAGIQSLCHFLSYLDSSWKIVSIHNPNIDIVGIGESTNPSFIKALEYGLDFNLYDHVDELNATYKLGTVYKNWREHEFINPLLNGTIAIHFDTHKLKDFALPRLEKKWGDKFQKIEGNISSISQTDEKVSIFINNIEHNFDYLIDCSGFPKSYEDYHVVESLTVNHALVHNIKERGDWKYTGHRATPDGWMFEIPLQNRQSYGYLFNDTITTVDDAKQNFSKEIGVPVDNLDNIEYKFISYYTKKLIDGRIMRNGNSAIFFEPLFANSLFNYNNINLLIYDYLSGMLTQSKIQEIFEELSKSVEDMIAFHYHGGSTYDNDFWKYVSKLSSEKLKTSHAFNLVRPALKNIVKEKNYISAVNWVYTARSLFTLDKNFGYNYFVDDATPFAL